MKKINRFTFKTIIIVLITSTAILSFSIFTNSGGYARKYIDADIPFAYQLNNTTPTNYVGPIDAGAQVWEDVPSSYWEFENGGFTPVSSDVYDGINLIFFDIQGVNFTPGTSVIAYSRTWTTGSGAGYRAVESDLVWNARDFPPSPTGAPGQQDLQSTIAHELGHHLGLGHAGPVGGPPGVGPLIVAATMYGYGISGDTTGRSLHIDDIGGVSAIYPVWKLQGMVTYAASGSPFDGVAITSPDVFGAEVYAPIFSNNVYQRPGYFRDTVTVAADGSYDVTILKQNFDLTAVYYGYQNQVAAVSFNNPGGIGQTELQTVDFQMQLSPMANITGIVSDSITGQAVQSRIQLAVTSAKPGVPQGFLADTTTGMSGDFSITVPAGENYEVYFVPEAPYSRKTLIIDDLPDVGVSLSVQVNAADIMFVNDDNTADFESFFVSSLENVQLSYHLWRTFEQGVPDSSVYNKFTFPSRVIWYTGNADTSVLSEEEQLSLINLLNGGGRLFLTGQNIAESSSSDTLLAGYLGIVVDQNVLGPIVRGVENDPIGDGLFMSTAGAANNQTSKDGLLISGNTQVSLQYGPTTPMGIAGIRAEDGSQGWKSVYLGFGFESINNTAGLRDTLLTRIFKWFDTVTGIDRPMGDYSDMLPGSFELFQNYPNPFNPQTTIRFAVPEPSEIQIIVYNSLGQKVRLLTRENYSPGYYEVVWDGRDDFGSPVASGIYFYKMISESGIGQARKLLLLK